MTFLLRHITTLTKLRPLIEALVAAVEQKPVAFHIKGIRVGRFSWQIRGTASPED